MIIVTYSTFRMTSSLKTGKQDHIYLYICTIILYWKCPSNKRKNVEITHDKGTHINKSN